MGIEASRNDTGTEAFAERLFDFWTYHTYHATTHLEENLNPFYVLSYLGYGLCSEVQKCLDRTLAQVGVPCRRVPLNGHGFSEYCIDGKWRILDPDLCAFYLCLDNETLASYADILEDPFIAVRTKAFGGSRTRAMDLAATWCNASLFEYVCPPAMPASAIDPKSVPDFLGNSFDLYPGERLVYHNDREPDFPVSECDDPRWPGALGKVEHVVDLGSRVSAGRFEYRAGFPIHRVVNETDRDLRIVDFDRNIGPGREFESRTGPLFRFTGETGATNGVLRVFSQGARRAFPLLGRGSNTVDIGGNAVGTTVAVTFDCDAALGRLPLPSVRVTNVVSSFRGRLPFFGLSCDVARPERLWWQIGCEGRFDFVPPNFERIQPYSPRVDIDALTDTFFSPGVTYHFRAKVKSGDVWGEWCSPFAFRVRKPARVKGVGIVPVSADTARLEWARTGGKHITYLVYASDSIDFVPELYADYRIDRMVNFRVETNVVARNLLLKTERNHIRVRRGNPKYYRIIAEENGRFSTPSSLVSLCSDVRTLRLRKGQTFWLCPSEDRGDVLQMRHRTRPSDKHSLGYEDIYVAERTRLPSAFDVSNIARVSVSEVGLCAAVGANCVEMVSDTVGKYTLNVFHGTRQPDIWPVRAVRMLKWFALRRQPDNYYEKYHHKLSLPVMVGP